MGDTLTALDMMRREDHLSWDEQKRLESEIKRVMFPELRADQAHYWGIGQCSKEAQIAYEMYRKIHNFRTRGLPEGQGGVLRDPPLNYSGEPFIEIEE